MFRIIIFKNILFLVYTSGKILRFNNQTKKWYSPIFSISSITNRNKSQYHSVGLDRTLKHRHSVRIHRLVAYCFMGLDYDNKKQQIDHIDHNTQNNNINNLRIVNNQGNQFNNIGRGTTLKNNKYISRIRINNKLLHIGNYYTEEEGHQAYLEVKKHYHIVGKEYTDVEVEEIRQILKQQINNKKLNEQINKKLNEKTHIMCICGGKHQSNNKNRHYTTKKHINYMNKI